MTPFYYFGYQDCNALHGRESKQCTQRIRHEHHFYVGRILHIGDLEKYAFFFGLVDSKEKKLRNGKSYQSFKTIDLKKTIGHY
jgi:hypothetical protein